MHWAGWGDDGGRTAVRGWGAATVLLGVTMVAVPRRVGAVAAGAGSVPGPLVVRVLGARDVVQGVLVVLHPSKSVVLVGCATDLLHAASMLPAARLFPAYRTAAMRSAILAVGSSALGGAALLLGTQGAARRISAVGRNLAQRM